MRINRFNNKIDNFRFRTNFETVQFESWKSIFSIFKIKKWFLFIDFGKLIKA